MAKINIQNEKLEGRGDAMDFLREIAQEIGRGYSSGPGWDYSEASGDEEESEPAEVLPEGEYVFKKDWSDRKEGDVISAKDLGDGAIFKDLMAKGIIEEIVDVPGDPIDSQGVHLEVGDSVQVVETGETGFIFGEEDGEISLHSDAIDFSGRTFKGSQLVKIEPKDPAEETGDEPWNKK